MRETRGDRRAFFFGFTKEKGEVLDGGHGNVPTVVAGQKGLTVSRRRCQLKASQGINGRSKDSEKKKKHTLPFRSKKKMADAMVWTVEDQVAEDGG